MDQDRLIRQMNEAVERARKARVLSEMQKRTAQELCTESEHALSRTAQRLERAPSKSKRIRHERRQLAATDASLNRSARLNKTLRLDYVPDAREKSLRFITAEAPHSPADSRQQ